MIEVCQAPRDRIDLLVVSGVIKEVNKAYADLFFNDSTPRNAFSNFIKIFKLLINVTNRFFSQLFSLHSDVD